MRDIVIIGAGPYGLSLASYLSFLDTDYEILGVPMGFWQSHMKNNALMRSDLPHSCPSNPDGFELFHKWYKSNIHLTHSRPLQSTYPDEFLRFIEYFISHFGINVAQKMVTKLLKTSEGYDIYLSSGETIMAKNVIIATGLAGSEHIPEILKGCEAPVYHSSQLMEVPNIEGSRVLVIGHGQSSAETAAFAVNKGALTVDMVMRADSLRFNSMHIPLTQEGRKRHFNIKHIFPYSSLNYRRRNYRTLVPVSIEPFMEDELAQNVDLILSSEISSITSNDANEIMVMFSNGVLKHYDKIISATGYKPGIDKLPFELGDEIKEELSLINDLPDLSERCESSLSGLFFIGSMASLRFGPQSNFIFGTNQMIPKVLASLVNA